MILGHQTMMFCSVLSPRSRNDSHFSTELWPGNIKRRLHKGDTPLDGWKVPKIWRRRLRHLCLFRWIFLGLDSNCTAASPAHFCWGCGKRSNKCYLNFCKRVAALSWITKRYSLSPPFQIYSRPCLLTVPLGVLRPTQWCWDRKALLQHWLSGTANSHPPLLWFETRWAKSGFKTVSTIQKINSRWLKAFPLFPFPLLLTLSNISAVEGNKISHAGFWFSELQCSSFQ